MRTYEQLNARSRAMHVLVAAKIRANPMLFEHVKTTLARWRVIVCESSQPYLIEWEQLVNAGLEPCFAMAVEDLQRADALRQPSPFTGILTNVERFAFLKIGSSISTY
jgi:hypothetical protein